MLKRKRMITLAAALGGAFLALSGIFCEKNLTIAYAGPGTLTEEKVITPYKEDESIRVLIMNTGYESIFHQSVILWAPVAMTMVSDGTETVIQPRTEVTITAQDERLNNGRLIFKVPTAADEISVPSVTRSLGTPTYAGTLEIKREKEGLTIINELNLENYLTKVIPSEMPSNYEPEALKAQAVCARTYAHVRILAGVYEKYGAHVDDSIEFQVYNNIRTDERVCAAVMDTYGKLLTYNGIPMEGYFFSTSCGYTTDSTIWKGAHLTVNDYIHGIPVMEGAAPMDLKNNDSFTAFIKDRNYPSYDSTYPFYRWETTTTGARLERKIPGIGSIKHIAVTERGIGGIAKSIRIEGTDGIRNVSDQNEIRALLGSRELTIKRNDNSTITGWDTLPSAYIAVEAQGTDENGSAIFQVYGGGYGHGVGMSQNGAQGMAKTGKNYEEILKFFFNGVEIINIP